jgi:uncharacterized protein YneF (UPF0154 family)
VDLPEKERESGVMWLLTLAAGLAVGVNIGLWIASRELGELIDDLKKARRNEEGE